MLEFLGWGFLSLHYVLMVLLCLFGLHRLSMVFRWHKYKDIEPENTHFFERLPNVTIQIPVYNERNVVGRIIDQTVLMDTQQIAFKFKWWMIQQMIRLI